MPISEATLHVPAGSIEAYRAAVWWKDFGTILEISKEFRWPVDDVQVTQAYATRDDAQGSSAFYTGGWDTHTGVDFSGTLGVTAVKAVADGTVVKKEAAHTGFGRMVVLRHGDGLYSLYGHLSASAEWTALTVGAAVEQGAVIGRVGNSGPAETPTHLHFEMRRDGDFRVASGGSTRYGYAPGHPDNWGYVDPRQVIGGVAVETLEEPVALKNADAARNVNVRGCPGTAYGDIDSPVVAKLGPGQQAVGRRKASVGGTEWYFVDLVCRNASYRGMDGGWVSADVLERVDGARPAWAADGPLNVRSEPGTAAEVLGQVFAGQRFVTLEARQLAGEAYPWWRIAVNGAVGVDTPSKAKEPAEGWVYGESVAAAAPQDQVDAGEVFGEAWLDETARYAPGLLEQLGAFLGSDYAAFSAKVQAWIDAGNPAADAEAALAAYIAWVKEQLAAAQEVPTGPVDFRVDGVAVPATWDGRVQVSAAAAGYSLARDYATGRPVAGAVLYGREGVPDAVWEKAKAPGGGYLTAAEAAELALPRMAVFGRAELGTGWFSGETETVAFGTEASGEFLLLAGAGLDAAAWNGGSLAVFEGDEDALNNIWVQTVTIGRVDAVAQPELGEADTETFDNAKPWVSFMTDEFKYYAYFKEAHVLNSVSQWPPDAATKQAAYEVRGDALARADDPDDDGLSVHYHALGLYQFDVKYALPPFLKYCVARDAVKYAAFSAYTGMATAELITALSDGTLLEDWRAVNDAAFRELQDEYEYLYYAKGAFSGWFGIGALLDPAQRGNHRDCVRGLFVGIRNLFGALSGVIPQFLAEEENGDGPLTEYVNQGRAGDMALAEAVCSAVGENRPDYKARYDSELEIIRWFVNGGGTPGFQALGVLAAPAAQTAGTGGGRIVADANGEWSVTCNGAASYSRSAIVSGVWSGTECDVAFDEDNPNVIVSGRLPTFAGLGLPGIGFLPSRDYTVTLTVTDADGHAASSDLTFTVYRKTQVEAEIPANLPVTIDPSGGGNDPARTTYLPVTIDPSGGGNDPARTTYLADPDGTEAVPPVVTTAYEGFAYDEDGTVRGTVTLSAKAAVKVDKKAGTATTNWTFTAKAILQSATVSFSGKATGAAASLASASKKSETLDVTLGADTFYGTFTDAAGAALNVAGARNAFADKKDTAAQARLAALKGLYNTALLTTSSGSLGDPDVAGYLTLTVGNLGAVKIAGKLADGTAVSGSAKLLEGLNEEGWLAVALYKPLYTKKGFVSGLLWINPEDGIVRVDTGYGWFVDWVCGDAKKGTFEKELDVAGGYYGDGKTAPPLAPGYTLSADEETEHFPLPAANLGEGDWRFWLDVPVTVAVGKMTVPKGTAPKKFGKGAEAWYEYSEVNQQNATLTCTAKTGLFKGAFKLYWEGLDAKGSVTLKTVGVSYAGVMVPTEDGGFAGLGTGTATVSKQKVGIPVFLTE